MRQQDLVQLFFRISIERFHLGSDFAEFSATLVIAQILHLCEHVAHLVASFVAHFVGDAADLIFLFVDELQFLLNLVASGKPDQSAAPKHSAGAARPTWSSGAARSLRPARPWWLSECRRYSAEHQ